MLYPQRFLNPWINLVGFLQHKIKAREAKFETPPGLWFLTSGLYRFRIVEEKIVVKTNLKVITYFMPPSLNLTIRRLSCRRAALLGIERLRLQRNDNLPFAPSTFDFHSSRHQARQLIATMTTQLSCIGIACIRHK